MFNFFITFNVQLMCSVIYFVCVCDMSWWYSIYLFDQSARFMGFDHSDELFDLSVSAPRKHSESIRMALNGTNKLHYQSC